MLTQQQRHFYEENGYLLVEGLFTAEEAGAFRQEAHGLIARLSQFPWAGYDAARV